jgi:hypothetical protein
MNLKREISSQNCLIKNLYATSDEILKMAPVTFYERDCGKVIIISREGENVTWTNGDFGKYGIETEVFGIKDIIFNIAKDFEEKVLYLFDVGLSRLVHPENDFIFGPPIYEKEITHYLMRSFDKKSFWHICTALHDIPTLLYSLSYMSSFMKMDLPIDSKIKRFMINLVAVSNSLPIPALEIYELDKIELGAKLKPESFPKELLADLRAMGDRVLEKRVKGLTSLISKEVEKKAELAIPNQFPPLSQISLPIIDGQTKTLISFQELVSNTIHPKFFPREVQIDLNIDVNITRLILTDNNKLTVYHNEGDTLKLMEMLTKWFPNFSFQLIDELAKHTSDSEEDDDKEIVKHFLGERQFYGD